MKSTDEMLIDLKRKVIKSLSDKLDSKDIEEKVKTACIILKSLDGLEDFVDSNRAKIANVTKGIRKSAKAKKYLDKKKIYFIGNIEEEIVKIGISNNVSGRIIDIQNGHPYKLEVLATIDKGTFKQEKQLHEKFKEHRLSGEWFDLSDNIKDFIKELVHAS